MAIALTPVEGMVSGNWVSSVTTAAFTPADSSFLVAAVIYRHNAAPGVTLSDSAGGTWTAAVERLGAASWDNSVGIYYRSVTTGASMTVTAAGSSAFRVSCSVSYLTGVDSAPPVAQSSVQATGARSGAYSAGLGGVGADDLVFALITGGQTHKSPFDLTVDSDFTEIHDISGPVDYGAKTCHAIGRTDVMSALDVKNFSITAEVAFSAAAGGGGPAPSRRKPRVMFV